MLQSEVQRWRSLTVRSNDGNIMNSLLAKPAPCLKKLGILGPYKWVAPANVFGGTAPKLEEVLVQSCALPWRSPILSDLTKLTLHRVGESSPQLNDLLDILAASPRLRDLKIAFTTIHITPGSRSRRVRLPNLRSVEMVYLSGEVMMRILASIDAPLSVDWDFFIRVDESEYMALEEQLAAVSNQLAAHAQNARNTPSTITLQMGYWREEEDDWDAILKYEAEREDLGSFTIGVMTHPGIHVDVLARLAGRIQPYAKSSPPKLRFVKMHRVHSHDDDGHLLCRLHRIFPNTQDITLVDLDFAALALAIYRLFPDPTTTGMSPLFPHLTKLTLKQDSHGDFAFWLPDYRRRSHKGGFDPLPPNLTLQLEGGWIRARGLQTLQNLVSGTLSLVNVQVREDLTPKLAEVDYSMLLE